MMCDLSEKQYAPDQGERLLNADRKVILVVDDNRDMLDVQKSILEFDGYEVFTAQSGREALEVLNKIDPPQLILLDMVMSDMTGTKFLNFLEERRPDILAQVPVVFFTGMSEVSLEKSKGIIRKGLGMSDFLKAVRSYLVKEEEVPPSTSFS